jgi:alginate O-acetyltransferase complex protein AlgI
MNFTDLNFLIFLSALLIIYVFLKKTKTRIWFLLIASYFFYSYWNWKYLPLILVTTYIDFFCGKKISEDGVYRKYYLVISLAFNLSILFVFKYFNFFISSFLPTSHLVSFIIPVGISFYTFQSMSYTIDVFFDKNKVENNFLNYALYVSFFPQLVAGPIERAGHLIPQLKQLRPLDYLNLRQGFQLALFGFFKKIVIADNLGIIADRFYLSHETFSKLDTLVAIYAYSFQIYFDFSSYTDIARGVAKMFGIELIENFKMPYLSTSLTEFWKRWHLSLTNWFRDYVYYTLCYNRHKRMNLYLAILIVFLMSGLWHGANWTFVVWGGAHGIILILEAFLFSKINLEIKSKFYKYFFIIFNFHLVSFLWVIFRSPNVGVAVDVFRQIICQFLFCSLNYLIINL